MKHDAKVREEGLHIIHMKDERNKKSILKLKTQELPTVLLKRELKLFNLKMNTRS